MKIFIGIDDTDSIDEGATGESAKRIIKLIEQKHWGICQGLTRHQLLLHPDIPYTSHNSSMCFTADIERGFCEKLIKEAGNFLEHDSAPGADPGLCIAVEKQIREKDRLIHFGYDAKIRILTKEAAYKLAQELGIHLSEHGGTGLGVIGAMAGVGLRMTNNDGRFQGRMELQVPGRTIRVEELIKKCPVEVVRSIGGYTLSDNEEIRLGDKLKTVLLDGKRTFLVYHRENENIWESCTNAHLENY